MAENKKGFVLYADMIHQIKKMKKEDAGELFVHILEYVNDLNPSTKNETVDLVFEPIKQQMKRDLRKWKEKIKKCSNAGKASAESRAKKPNKKEHTLTDVDLVEQSSTDSTVTVNDNVNVITLEGFNLNFIDQDFLKPIVDWATYRKNTLKKEITTQQVLEACYRQLHELSGKDPKEAERIVTYTISNNYKSLCKDDRKVVVNANPMQGVL